MSIEYVDQDIRHECIDYFPTLLDKKIYYQYAKQVYLSPIITTVMDGKSNIHPSITTKWKLPVNVLNHLDQVQDEWNKSNHVTFWTLEDPNLLLPNLLLLEPIILKQHIEIENWYWKDKSKSFPLIHLTTSANSSILQRPPIKEKIKLDSSVINRLATLLDTQDDEELHRIHEFYGIQLEEVNQSNTSSIFMPQRDINYFQSLRTTHSPQQIKSRRCELDFARFNFNQD